MKTIPRKKTGAISRARWVSYALASAATAAGGSATSAEAEIHYSGAVHETLGGNHMLLKLPLSGGASLQFYRIASFVGHAQRFHILGADASARGGYFLSNLSKGENVSTGTFVRIGNDGYSAFLLNYYGSGPFSPHGTGFIGFKFDTGRGIQNGWARIRTVTRAPDDAIAIVDYAWADPGEPILAGQIHAGPARAEEAPVSGSLGHLALGNIGRIAWLRAQGR